MAQALPPTAPPAQPRRPIASSLIGLLVLLPAAIVAAGWIGQIGTIVHGIPGAVMVFSTALCFVLVGLALAPGGLLRDRAHRQLQRLMGSIVGLLGAVVLFEHVAGQSLLLDWPDLHRWMDSEHPNPGQMSLPTSVTFVLTGVTLVLMNRVRAAWQGLLVQLLTALIIAVGVIGTMGWALKLDLVYAHYLFDRMSLLTALCFILAGTGLWLDCRRLDWYRARRLVADEDIRISLNAIALLAAVLGVTLAAGFGIVARQLDAGARKQLLEPLKRRADQFQSTIALRSAQTEMIAGSPAVATLLRNLNAPYPDEKSLVQLRAIAESLLPHGFSGVAIQNATGRNGVGAGHFAAQAELEVPLGERPFVLLWDDGFILRVRLPVKIGDTTLGSVLTEQRLHRLTTAIEYSYDFAAGGEVALCSRREGELRCFPRRADARATTMPYAESLPAARALRGETGVRVLRDARGANVMAAYGPVANLGLALVLQTDTSEIYAPLRHQMYVMVALLAAMMLIGTLLLYWRVAPLARRLFLHEQRLKLALESSRSAVWDLDLAQGLVYLSEQWSALLGGVPQATSTTLEELYRLVHPDDVAQVERKLRATLRSDDLSYDVEHRVRAPAGTWIWIHSVGKVVERDSKGRALRMIGVNTNIERRKQAESFIERRASRDEATALPNRAVFTDRLHMAMARARRAPPDRSLMAVLVLNLEQFKEIGESKGTEAAQAFLRDVVRRLQPCIRATDTMARMGADEFAVILEELGLTDQACRVAAKLIAALESPIPVQRTAVTARTSIGISFYDGVIQVSAEELVAKAQSAMYDARNEGPNGFRVTH